MRNKERGYLLLELMVALMIIEIIAVMAAPNLQQLQYALQSQSAKAQVARIRDAQAALAICTAQNESCGTLPQIVPTPGTLQTGGYLFTFTQGANVWTYAAAPVALQPFSYFTDQTGILRCSTVAGVIADATSSVCP